MHTDTVLELTHTFEVHAQKTDDSIEFWLARDLQSLLGYSKWSNFQNVIEKAQTSCETAGHNVSDHFADVGKMVDLGSGSQREIEDMMLTRFACYLIAQNGDPSKEQIAFAQTYFAVQTRKAELISQRLLDCERVEARGKLTSTEKELSAVIFEQTASDRHFGAIRSKGDNALFGKNTKQMKAKWNVPDNRPLADFAPTIVLKAKDLAAEITIHNTREKQFTSENSISAEHIYNNRAVRKALVDRGVRPEELQPEEDVKKVERRLVSDEKKAHKNPAKLESSE